MKLHKMVVLSISGCTLSLLIGCASTDTAPPSTITQTLDSEPVENLSLLESHRNLNSDSGDYRVEINVSQCPDLGPFWRYQTYGAEDRVYWTDEAAAYWQGILPFLSAGQGYYEIRGDYVEARFFSFESYDPGPIDILVDQNIQPDPGSYNPFSGQGGGSEDNYTINVRPVRTPNFLQKQSNELFAGNRFAIRAQPAYALIYRIYDGFTLQGSVPPEFAEDPLQWQIQGQRDLPQLFYVADQFSRPKYRNLEEFCADIRGIKRGDALDTYFTNLSDLAENKVNPFFALTEPDALRLASNPPAWFVGLTTSAGAENLLTNYPVLGGIIQTGVATVEEFLLAAGYDTPYPNSASGYISTFLNSSYGDVAVARFRPPTFPDPTLPDPLPIHETQVRYWSFCIYNTALSYTADCLVDRDLKVDEDGFVTLAFSWPSQRPLDPGTGAPTQNWLPFITPVTLVTHRQILPSRSFRQSPAYYEDICEFFDDSCLTQAAALQRWMGEFYPQIRYCSRENYELNRCEQLFR